MKLLAYALLLCPAMVFAQSYEKQALRQTICEDAGKLAVVVRNDPKQGHDLLAAKSESPNYQIVRDAAEIGLAAQKTDTEHSVYMRSWGRCMDRIR